MSYCRESLEALEKATWDYEVTTYVRTKELSSKRRHMSSIVPSGFEMGHSKNKQEIFGRN